MTHRLALYFAVLVSSGRLSILLAGVPPTDVAASTTTSNAVSGSINPVLLELSAGAAYLKDLKRLGALPGVATNDLTEISTGSLPGGMLEELRYPFAATFLVTRRTDSFTNHYTVMRPTAAAAWQLKKAWRTDPQDKKVMEWPVNSVPKLDASTSPGDVSNLAAFQDHLASARATPDPLLPELYDAASALEALGKDGRLPGGPMGGHEQVTTGLLPRPESLEVKYPLAVTFLVNESGEFFTNHYTLVRPEKGAAWRLDKAWRTNPEGRTVTEWQVK